MPDAMHDPMPAAVRDLVPATMRDPVPAAVRDAPHDHRSLGRELDLFDTDPLIGAGLPYWLPAGAAVRHALEEYVRDVERRAGYQHVYSPVLGKRELYEISGHWAHYRDDMYPPIDVGGEQAVLRPSLCPHHALIYRSRSRRYRELPLHIAELVGMYRSELSRVLGGLTRVRAIQLNDAHVFCAPEQVADEVCGALDLIGRAHAALGITPARYRLSLPGAGQKYAAAPEPWRRATELLVEALERSGIGYEAERGEAAFYGPKYRRADRRRRRPRVHPVHRAGRLPPARTLRPALRRRGRRETPAGGGAPQRHRQRGARRGPPHRGARRRVPGLARPRPARGPAGLRGAGGPGARGRATVPGAGPAGRGRRAGPGHPRGPRPAGPAGFRTRWSSGSARPLRGSSRCGCGTGGASPRSPPTR